MPLPGRRRRRPRRKLWPCRGRSLAWQPIVSSIDGTVRSQEAFVRIPEPTLSAPVSFFAAAREPGRIVDLGRAVRRGAASEPTSFPGQLAWVNIDAAELFDEELVDVAPPLAPITRFVILELSHRTILGAPDGVVARLRELRRLGFRIAVDDPGSPEVGRAAPARVRGAQTIDRGFTLPGRLTRTGDAPVLGRGP